jgi:predicted metal-dependent enzyme (double-stranded beta helix superfamily)
MIKAVYKPFGLIVSVLGGVLASTLFSRVWRAIAHEDESPDAKDRDRGWSEILISAALQGAMFGLVKAAVDRAGATGFAHATGTWPGKTSDDD